MVIRFNYKGYKIRINNDAKDGKRVIAYHPERTDHLIWTFDTADQARQFIDEHEKYGRKANG